MARYRAKVDGNHTDIVSALRSVGAGVQSLAMVLRFIGTAANGRTAPAFTSLRRVGVSPTANSGKARGGPMGDMWPWTPAPETTKGQHDSKRNTARHS